MKNRIRAMLTLKWWIPAAISIGILPLSAGLTAGHIMDDHIHRIMLEGAPALPCVQAAPWDLYLLIPEDDAFVEKSVALGTAVWWRSESFQISFMRPLSSLSRYLDYLLFDGAPLPSHLVNLLWTAALFAAVALLYRRFEGPGMATGLAVLLFALDEGHAYPAVWIANRNALIAGLFSVLSLLFHHRYRTDGSRISAVLSPLLLALGLCSGEISIGILGYFVAYALFIDPAGFRRGALRLLPHLGVTVLWRTVYNSLGYGTYGADLYIDPLQAPVEFAVAALGRIPVLVASHFGYLPADISVLVPRQLQPLYIGGALLWLTWTGIVLYPLLKSSRIARFWCAGMLAAAVPAAATFPHNRLFLLAGIGGTALVAALVVGFYTGTLSVVHRKTTATFAALSLLLHIGFAPLSTLKTIDLLKNINQLTESAARTLSDAPDIEKKRVMILAAPDMFLSAFVPFWRYGLGLPLPERVEAAVNTISPVEIFRESETALRLTVKGGQFRSWTHPLTRKRSAPMPPGHTVHQPGITYEVLTATAEGEPETIRMTLDRPLDHPTLEWVVWRDGGYVPFTLPPIGEAAVVDIDEWDLLRDMAR